MHTTGLTCLTRYLLLLSIPGWFLPLITFLIPLIAIPSVLWGRSPGDGPPPAVTVQIVQELPINPPTEYVGRIEAIQVVELQARVEGLLERVAFQEGAAIKAGDLLFQIEQSPYKTRLDENQAKVNQAEAALNTTRQYLHRLQTVKSGGVSAFDLETAQSQALQDAARLQEATASLAMARLNLDYTTIRAPIDGRIGRTAFSRGNLVGPGSGSMARIVQTDPIRVVYAMNETDLMAMRTASDRSGAPLSKAALVLQLRLANNEIYPLSGRFDFLDNQVDPRTGTIAARAVFENPEGLLLPGQFVTVITRREQDVKTPVVPQSAVLMDRDGSYVFVVDDQKKVQMRRIVTGAAIETQWAVQSGLSVGETIVVQGIQKVSSGQPVSPSPAAERSKE